MHDYFAGIGIPLFYIETSQINKQTSRGVLLF